MDRLPVSTVRLLGLATFALLVLALYLNLGLMPLRLEEPRRALIALEMIFSGDYLAPTEFGVAYTNKPPLWNWVIVAAYQLFGGYTEFAVRFFSVLSLLATGWIMYLLGRRYLDEEQAILASLLFLVSGQLLFYFSLLGEIDLFYSLLTFSAFAALFHFYQQGAYWTAFLLFYFLNGLGALTKGMPSVAFAGITVLTLLAYRRDLGRLFSAPHLVGGLVFLAVIGLYLGLYALHHPVENYLETLWTQASGRTLVAEQASDSPLQHWLFYPLQTLQAVLPAAFLLPFLFYRRFWDVVRRNPMIEFYFWVGMSNFALYWLFSPGARQRYIYMLYPLLVGLLLWFYRELKDRMPIRERLVNRVIFLFMLLGAVAIGALPFLEKFRSVPNLMPVSVIGVLFALGSITLAWKRPRLRLWGLIWIVILLRLVMDLTVIPHKAAEGSEFRMRQTAFDIHEISRQEPVRLFGTVVCSRTIVFYLERESGHIVRRVDRPVPGELFIAERRQLVSHRYETIHGFTDDEGGDLLLVRFLDKSVGK